MRRSLFICDVCAREERAPLVALPFRHMQQEESPPPGWLLIHVARIVSRPRPARPPRPLGLGSIVPEVQTSHLLVALTESVDPEGKIHAAYAADMAEYRANVLRIFDHYFPHEDPPPEPETYERQQHATVQVCESCITAEPMEVYRKVLTMLETDRDPEIGAGVVYA